MNLDEKLDTYVNPSKRSVDSTMCTITASSDNSSHFRTFLKSSIDNAGENGRPARSLFYITNNNNNLPTDRNVILRLNLPIFPPLFKPDTNSKSWDKNCGTFVRYATSPTAIQKSYHSLDPDARNSYVEDSADLLMSYLLTEIGTRYSVAKKYGDTKTMQQLKALNVVKEENFNLEMFDVVLKTPNGLIRDSGRVFFTTQTEKGTIRNYLNDQQAECYYRHQQIKRKSEEGYEYAFDAMSTINRYETYDIEKAKFTQTFGGHVVGKSSQHPADKVKPSVKQINAIDLSQEIEQIGELGE